MSCESNPNKFVRLACVLGAGINKLAGKRAFYAGVAVVSAGVFGVAGIAMAINRKNQPILQESVQLVNSKSVPKFQSREK